jgi:hypothetical protein
MANESLPLFVLPESSTGVQRKLTPTQAAYMAGLLDGEGYFSLTLRDKPSKGYHYKRFEAIVSLTMTNKTYMEGIAALVPWGGGTVGLSNRRLKGRAKPAYRMKWSGTAAVQLCRAILPYIRLKKAHVELLLAVADAKERAQAERTGQGHAYPLWIVELQTAAMRTFRILNIRGQDNAASVKEADAFRRR